MKFKKIFKVFIVIGLIFSLLFGLLAIYLYSNQDKLIKPIVAEINKSLLVPVQVQQLGLSLRKFPNVSVRLQNVYCPENVRTKPDTLFALNDFFVQLSLWDMLWGRYVINKLSLEQGVLRIKQFKNGENNFSIFKESENQTNTSFSLSSISLNNVKLYYQDESSGLQTLQYLEKANLRGDFSGDMTSLSGSLSAQNQSLSLPGLEYKIALKYSGGFSFSTMGEIIELESKKFRFNNEEASLLIHLEEGDKRVLIKGEELNIQNVLDVVPQEYASNLGGLQAIGSVKLSFLLTENAWKEWGVQGAFEWNAKKTIFSSKNIEFGNSYLKGFFENNLNKRYQSGYLNLEKFEIQSGSSSYSGTFAITNFKSPLLTLNTQFTAQAAELYQLNPIKGMSQVNGLLQGQISFENQFKSLSQITKSDFAKTITSGTLQVQDFNFEIDGHPVSIANGRFTWAGNSLKIEPTLIVNDKNDLTLEGEISNFIPYLFVDNQELIVSGQLKSNYLNPENWFKSKGASATEGDPFLFSLPQNLKLNLDVTAEKILMDRFQGEEIGFRLNLENQVLKLQNFTSNSMEGSVLAQVSIKAQALPIRVEILGEMDKLELKNVFYTFYNFGQQTLTEREISGRLSGDVQMNFMMDSGLNIDLNSLQAISHLSLKKGRLVNFEPMKALSRFAKLEELEDIKFSELNNEIRIQNGKIEIPKMRIESNVMKLDLAGNHSFENIMDYHLGLQLRDVLYAQYKKKESELDELLFENEEEGTMLYVKMQGSVDQPQISLDKGQYRERIKADWKQNANPFKKPVEDSLKKPKPKYQIEWDED